MKNCSPLLPIMLVAVCLFSTACREDEPLEGHTDLPIRAWGQGLPPKQFRGDVREELMASRAAKLTARAHLGHLAGYSQTQGDAMNLDFVSAWTEFGAPIEQEGTWYVQGTMPAPTCQAFANAMREWIEYQRSLHAGGSINPWTLQAFEGPGGRTVPAVDVAKLDAAQRRLDRWKGKERRYKAQLHELARDLGMIQSP